MAAWIVVGLAIGVVIGGGGVWLAGEQTRAELAVLRKAPRYIPPPDSTAMERVLDRLLDAAVPKHVEAVLDASEVVGSPGEYDPPEEPVGDWTDPFFGLERPLVARLAPGQQIIPGLPREDLEDGGVDAVEAWREAGEGAFDEWARDTMAPDALPHEAWVQPIDLEDQ